MHRQATRYRFASGYEQAGPDSSTQSDHIYVTFFETAFQTRLLCHSYRFVFTRTITLFSLNLIAKL